MRPSRGQPAATRSTVSTFAVRLVSSHLASSPSPSSLHPKEHSCDSASHFYQTVSAAAATVGGAPFRRTRSLLQSSSRHKIIIPPLGAFDGNGGSINSGQYHSLSSDSIAQGSTKAASAASEYAQNRRLNPDVVQFITPENAAEVQRAHQIDAVRESSDALAQQIWLDSKSHLRKQAKLVEEFGVEGAVRETLQPSSTSFREQLRQRPLDRAILQEIYLGLHGRRIERKLKRGVSWEHWITKGDGTAPVFNTSEKAQQTFAFGGDIKQVRCATHPQQFPVVLSHPLHNTTASISASPVHKKTKKQHNMRRQGAKTVVPRENLLPEVAVIGRTSSGKSSLINAVVNATITPYGHLRGTTDAVRFYNVANRLMLVDCPGYGHYDPMATPPIDAENAVKAMRAYLACGAAPGALRRSRTKSDAVKTGKENDENDIIGFDSGKKNKSNLPRDSNADDDVFEDDDFSDNGLRLSDPFSKGHSHKGAMNRQRSLVYQPRNLRRVFVCVSAHGMQHLDYAYCELLESYRIPFSVIITKTDAAPIRFLARLTDYTRSQLVRYTQCKEILLTSSLRIAGIDKVQELLGSFAAADDPLHGATMDFSAIV